MKPERIEGEDRNETSVAVASKFFKNPTVAIVANSLNYPDGLCGGPLATLLGVPLILTCDVSVKDAAEYMDINSIEDGFVLGGESALKKESTYKIFKQYERE